jgi:hypothetical protein
VGSIDNKAFIFCGHYLNPPLTHDKLDLRSQKFGLAELMVGFGMVKLANLLCDEAA